MPPIGTFVNISNSKALSTGSPQTPVAQSLTAGNLAVVVVRHSGAVSITAMTDTAGNTYAPADVGVGPPSTGDNLRVWYCANCLGHATNVVSTTFSGSPTSALSRVIQFSGFGSNPFKDSARGFRNPAGTSVTASAAVTTTGSDQLVILAANHNNTGANWSQSDSSSDPATITERGDDGTLCIAECQLNTSGVTHTFSAATAGSTVKEIVVVLFGLDPAVTHRSRAYIGTVAGNAFVS